MVDDGQRRLKARDDRNHDRVLGFAPSPQTTGIDVRQVAEFGHGGTNPPHGVRRDAAFLVVII